MLRTLCMFVVGMSVVACEATPPLGPLDARRVKTVGQWTVHHGARLLGRMDLIEIDDPQLVVRLYRVRNAAGQKVGHMDMQGRVYKWEVFRTQETFKGIYSRTDGLALLLEVDGEIEVRTVTDGAFDASTGRG